MRNGMLVGGINLMKYETLPENIEVITQVRYNDPGTLSKLNTFGEKVSVEFYAPVKGIAPGQSAVFFEGDDVIGGGVIHSSMNFNEN
jgi:tRNA-specific 2-thiouridylase